MLQKEFGKITLSEAADRVTLKNNRLVIDISKEHGEWLGFSLDGRDLINYQIPPQVPVDFKVDGQWLIETHGCRFVGFHAHEEEDKVSLHIHLGVKETPPPWQSPPACWRGPANPGTSISSPASTLWSR